MRALACVLTLGAVVVAFATPADARLTRALHLDGDFKGSAVVMIGTVESIGVITPSTSGPFSSTVEIQELRVRVDLALRNSRGGQLLRVRHPRVLPSTKPVINGFGPTVIRRGWTYLFFLARDKQGHLKLAVVEDHTLVDFDRTLLRAAIPRLRKLPAFDRLLTLLRKRINTCTAACGRTIWLTNASRAFKRRYVSGPAKRHYIRDLEAITKRSRNDNTLNAAYTVLGYHNVQRVLPRIVSALTKKRARRPMILSNRLSWLQGFNKPVQIKALQKIIARAQNPGVISAAQWKLRHLRKRP